MHCSTEEDYGGQSKSNEGQVALVKHIVDLLSTLKINDDRMSDKDLPKITVLSPYTKQTKLLRSNLRVPAFTVDSFQGREDEIIIMTTVRSNANGDLGERYE